MTDSVMMNNMQFRTNTLDNVTATRSLATARKAQNIENSNSFGEQLKETINGKKPVDKALMDVCYEMESLFVGKMLKEMRKNVEKNEWTHGGFAEEIFEDMLYDEYALNMSRNSNLGLAKMLYEEMSRFK